MIRMTDLIAQNAALQAHLASLPLGHTPPEIIVIAGDTVACDGGTEAGHPRVYLTINAKKGFVVCPYCGRIYVSDPTQKVSAAH